MSYMTVMHCLYETTKSNSFIYTNYIEHHHLWYLMEAPNSELMGHTSPLPPCHFYATLLFSFMVLSLMSDDWNKLCNRIHTRITATAETLNIISVIDLFPPSKIPCRRFELLCTDSRHKLSFAYCSSFYFEYACEQWGGGTRTSCGQSCVKYCSK